MRGLRREDGSSLQQNENRKHTERRYTSGDQGQSSAAGTALHFL